MYKRQSLASALGLAGIFSLIRAVKLNFDPKALANAKDLPHPKDFKDKYYRGLPYDGHIEDLSYLIKQIPIIGGDLGAAYMLSLIHI